MTFENTSQQNTPSLFPTAGVYTITCLNNSKKYVGASLNVAARLRTHKSELRSGTHDCADLQADFTAFGENNFVFQPFKLFIGNAQTREEATRQCERVETAIIESFPPEELYNTFADWRSRPGEANSFYGRTHTQEARDANREAHLGRPSGFYGRTHSEEVRARLREQNRGTTNVQRRRPVSIDGVVYESVSAAQAGTGYDRRIIRNRCNDDRHPNWFFVNQNS